MRRDEPDAEATEASDLHYWEESLRLAMRHLRPDVATTLGKKVGQ